MACNLRPSRVSVAIGRWRCVLESVREVRPPGGAAERAASPKVFQWLLYGMSAALILATLVGLVLAFRSVKPRWPVWLALVAGVLIPVGVLWLGSSR